MNSSKQRLDLLLVERALVSSRSRAQSYILSGKVLVEDQPVLKVGQQIRLDAPIRLRDTSNEYVSRGAYKLLAAIESFQIQVKDRTAMDVGASTGGFTQVLLNHQINKVFAVDVGENLLAWPVRSDPRVVPIENTNARHLTFQQIGQTIDLMTLDLSFISIVKVLPALLCFATPETDWIALIKPQFEIGRGKVGKGGIVRSETDQRQAVDEVLKQAQFLGLETRGLIKSPLKGQTGNQEYLAYWRLIKTPTP